MTTTVTVLGTLVRDYITVTCPTRITTAVRVGPVRGTTKERRSRIWRWRNRAGWAHFGFCVGTVTLEELG
jgi:hypothetical protein